MVAFAEDWLGRVVRLREVVGFPIRAAGVGKSFTACAAVDGLAAEAGGGRRCSE